MSTVKVWIQAARLRTLPLSLSGIIVGAALASREGFFETRIFVLALLTTVGFQVTSNFANDYGDGVKGTDTKDRIGPARVLQRGLLSQSALKKGIIVAVILTFLCAILLLYTAFGIEHLPYFFLFLALGIFGIWAALAYTMGSRPYGYRGWGDVFVFLFFGLVAVLGSLFLYTKNLNSSALLPAVAIGMLCVGVLNLNNLRDIASDQKHGKHTLVVKMGFKNGKIYHVLLMITAFLCFLGYTWIEKIAVLQSYYMVSFLPIAFHVRSVITTQEPKNLDGELKIVVVSTFLVAILFYVANT